MRRTATRDLYNYWNRLRGVRAAPERSEIDLGAIRGHLADIFMLEVDSAHRFPFVMSGSRVNAFFCGEQKGRSFLDLWPRHEIHNVATFLLTVIDAACPVVAAGDAGPEGYAKADLELLFLPVWHPGYAQARILGIITAAAKPTWLGLLPVQHLTLRSLRAIGDVISPVGELGGRIPGVSAPEWRGHLRVFEGGR